MAKLERADYFTDREFSVSLWQGKAGDSRQLVHTKPMKRAEFPSLSVVIRGSFEHIKPSGPSGWILKTGETSLDKTEDWDEIGTYTYTALEDNSQELCMGTHFSTKVGETVDNPYRIVKTLSADEEFSFDRSCLLVIISGEITTSKGNITGPYFVRVKNPITIKAMTSSRIALLAKSI
jgi:hypothetical protein